ncbi:hypothetical protein LINPERHAP2_LOCUS32600 [Linum perenne]
MYSRKRQKASTAQGMFLYVELNQVRQMVMDISCLDKDLDIRLILCSKRILTALPEQEEVDSEYVCNLLKDNLRLIWLQFLSCERFP